MVGKTEKGFLVPYTIKNSPNKGQGVFADGAVHKDTIVWRHVRGQYTVYDERSFTEFLASLPQSEAVYELEHVFGVPEFPGCTIRVHDDGELINHSSQPNLTMNKGAVNNDTLNQVSQRDALDVTNALLSDRFALIAIRNIDAGEELTLDYTIGTEDPD
jgi:hypothetical protein